MKALAIDSVTSCISFAVKNENKYAHLSIDTGLHQSEQIVPCIARVLEMAELRPEHLEFTAVCLGPGSFTGLRLGFSALKSLELAYNCPLYGIPTLEAYALPYASWQGAVIPVIDAKKHKFYAAVYHQGKETVPPADASIEEILQLIDPEERALATGPDAPYFAECARALRPAQTILTFEPLKTDCCEQLLAIAAKKFAAKEKGLAEYDGPLYLRSET